MASIDSCRPSISPLKRTFDQLAPPPEILDYRKHHEGRRSVSLTTYPPDRERPYVKRRTHSNPIPAMISQQPTAMSPSFPSFMSVYRNEDSPAYNNGLYEQDSHTERNAFFPSINTKTQNTTTISSTDRFLHRRDSSNSMISYSTASSPTTQGSTFDSPLMADPSPSSSPESATSKLPPMAFQPKPRPTQIQTQHGQTAEQVDVSAFADDARKNVKKLTLDMQIPSLMRPATSDGTEPFSAPVSPLREPLKTGRRKPNNLTIRTPGFNQLTFARNGEIPPTPAQRPILHQLQSSPSLPALRSPSLGPPGGMILSIPSIVQHVKDNSQNNISAVIANSNLPSLREEDTYQPPQSQEAPEKGYPDGPVRIYDTGVWLYLEPSAEEASKFDTVINVAKEIKNPFENKIVENNTVMSVWRNKMDNRMSLVEPQTAASEMSFKSALEWPQSSDPTTPTTPRPGSISVPKQPEYLHVRWDHNSEIIEDLFPLCQLIDNRVAAGKKVLIHCQLGVSRSASLIIAYGLYKGYEQDFHSMYMTVKKRSQWVGPNMSLIYQLTDFRSRCVKGDYQNSSKPPNPAWFRNKADNVPAPVTIDPTPAKTHTDTESKVKDPSKTPTQQPNRLPLRLNKELPPIPTFSDEPKSFMLPPPSSNGSKMMPPPRPTTQAKPKPRAVPRPLPFRAMGFGSNQMSIPPHKPKMMPGLTFAESSASMDLAKQDVPSTPSLFSPRATEFRAAPFGVTTAGDLVTTTPKVAKPPPGAFPGGKEWHHAREQSVHRVLPFDPRSPPHVDEVKEIYRYIDDFV